jgi:hypothetical protein
MLRFTDLSTRVGVLVLGTVMLSGCAASLTEPSADVGKPAPADNSKYVGLPSGDGESMIIVEQPNKTASPERAK